MQNQNNDVEENKQKEEILQKLFEENKKMRAYIDELQTANAEMNKQLRSRSGENDNKKRSSKELLRSMSASKE